MIRSTIDFKEKSMMINENDCTTGIDEFIM